MEDRTPTGSRRGRTAVIVGAAVVLVGGAVATGLLLGRDDERASRVSSATEVAEGEAFEVDGFVAEGGWSVRASNIGGAEIADLTVLLEDARDRQFEVVDGLVFELAAGDEVLTEVFCTTHEMQEGESRTLLCAPLDDEDLPDYDTIRVELDD